MQKKKNDFAVFFDLSHAFCTVYKKDIMLKILQLRVIINVYSWIPDVIYQGSARVKMDAHLIKSIKFRVGVLQASVIASALFLLR